MKWTEEQERFVAEMYAKGNSPEAVHEQYGWVFPEPRGFISIRDARSKRPNVKRMIAEFQEVEPGISFDPQKEEVKVSGTLPTEDEIIDAVGLDKKDWEIERMSVKLDEEPGGPHKQTSWVKLARKKRKKSGKEITEDFVDRVCAQVEARAPKIRLGTVKNPERNLISDTMYELFLPDLHLDKYGWKPEVGENSDTQIAMGHWNECVDRHVSEIGPCEYVLLPIGNDFFQYDSLLQGKIPSTTLGTAQDADGRWQRSFELGEILIDETVKKILSVAPSVEIVVVPGNHDVQKMYYLGRVLGAMYRNTPEVKVDNSPNVRKYHNFGLNAIGFTHGKSEKIERLGSIMGVENPGPWRHREWHVGHLHRREVLEDAGVIVRRFMALSGTDAWHHENGYVGNQKGGSMLKWHRELGPVQEFHHYIQGD